MPGHGCHPCTRVGPLYLHPLANRPPRIMIQDMKSLLATLLLCLISAAPAPRPCTYCIPAHEGPVRYPSSCSTSCSTSPCAGYYNTRAVLGYCAGPSTNTRCYMNRYTVVYSRRYECLRNENIPCPLGTFACNVFGVEHPTCRVGLHHSLRSLLDERRRTPRKKQLQKAAATMTILSSGSPTATQQPAWRLPALTLIALCGWTPLQTELIAQTTQPDHGHWLTEEVLPSLQVQRFSCLLEQRERSIGKSVDFSTLLRHLRDSGYDVDSSWDFTAQHTTLERYYLSDIDYDGKTYCCQFLALPGVPSGEEHGPILDILTPHSCLRFVKDPRCGTVLYVEPRANIMTWTPYALLAPLPSFKRHLDELREWRMIDKNDTSFVFEAPNPARQIEIRCKPNSLPTFCLLKTRDMRRASAYRWSVNRSGQVWLKDIIRLTEHNGNCRVSRISLSELDLAPIDRIARSTPPIDRIVDSGRGIIFRQFDRDLLEQGAQHCLFGAPGTASHPQPNSHRDHRPVQRALGERKNAGRRKPQTAARTPKTVTERISNPLITAPAGEDTGISFVDLVTKKDIDPGAQSIDLPADLGYRPETRTIHPEGVPRAAHGRVRTSDGSWHPVTVHVTPKRSPVWPTQFSVTRSSEATIATDGSIEPPSETHPFEFTVSEGRLIVRTPEDAGLGLHRVSIRCNAEPVELLIRVISLDD